MNTSRLLVTALATGAAALSVAACTAGITTPSPAPSHSPPVAASHTSSAAPSSPATVNLGAPIGNFPVPHGAQVVANMPCGKQLLLELSSVTPPEASSFYASALPQAGYTITVNTLTADPDTGAPRGMTEITFGGRGYTGLIIAMANLGAGATANPSMASLPASISKNFMEVSLSPKGTPSSAACAS